MSFTSALIEPTEVQVVPTPVAVALDAIVASLTPPPAAGTAKVASSRRKRVVPADAPGSGTYPTACDAPEATNVGGVAQIGVPPAEPELPLNASPDVIRRASKAQVDDLSRRKGEFTPHRRGSFGASFIKPTF